MCLALFVVGPCPMCLRVPSEVAGLRGLLRFSVGDAAQCLDSARALGTGGSLKDAPRNDFDRF